MFKDSLELKLKKIFDIKKVVFNAPSDQKEQEIIFVKVDNVISRVKGESILARVIGSISVYGDQDRFPFGFFIKKIHLANHDDTYDLFFHNVDQAEPYYGEGNLTERRLDFVYFFESQFNPESGIINQCNITSEVY